MNSQLSIFKTPTICITVISSKKWHTFMNLLHTDQERLFTFNPTLMLSKPWFYVVELPLHETTNTCQISTQFLNTRVQTFNLCRFTLSVVHYTFNFTISPLLNLVGPICMHTLDFINHFYPDILNLNLDLFPICVRNLYNKQPLNTQIISNTLCNMVTLDFNYLHATLLS